MTSPPGSTAHDTDAQVEEVIARTLDAVSEGATHWSKRELARQVGISPTTDGFQFWDQIPELTNEAMRCHSHRERRSDARPLPAGLASQGANRQGLPSSKPCPLVPRHRRRAIRGSAA